MAIATKQYIRKPLYVDAVRVTSANFEEMAAWCQGEIQQDEAPSGATAKKYIKVRVHNPKNPRQTKAFVGDWLLYTERGYKVYTNKAFHASFDIVNEITKSDAPITQVVVDPKKSIAQAVADAREPHALDRDAVSGRIVSHEYAEQHPDTTVHETFHHAEQPVNVESVPEQEKIEPAAAEGKRVLSIEEQSQLTPEEVRDLIRAGEVVLAQDIAQA